MKQSSECLVNNKDLYQLQVGNMTVEFKYSENNKIQNKLKESIDKTEKMS